MSKRQKVIKLFLAFYIQQYKEFAKLRKLSLNSVNNKKKSLASVIIKIIK